MSSRVLHVFFIFCCAAKTQMSFTLRKYLLFNLIWFHQPYQKLKSPSAPHGETNSNIWCEWEACSRSEVYFMFGRVWCHSQLWLQEWWRCQWGRWGSSPGKLHATWLTAGRWQQWDCKDNVHNTPYKTTHSVTHNKTLCNNHLKHANERRKEMILPLFI